MKITKSQLKQIIKEELINVLSENVTKMPSGLVVYEKFQSKDRRLKSFADQKVLVLPRDTYRRHRAYLKGMEKRYPARIKGRYITYEFAQQAGWSGGSAEAQERIRREIVDDPELSKMFKKLRMDSSCSQQNLRGAQRLMRFGAGWQKEERVGPKSRGVYEAGRIQSSCFREEITKLMQEYITKRKAAAKSGFEQAMSSWREEEKEKPAKTTARKVASQVKKMAPGGK